MTPLSNPEVSATFMQAPIPGARGKSCSNRVTIRIFALAGSDFIAVVITALIVALFIPAGWVPPLLFDGSYVVQFMALCAAILLYVASKGRYWGFASFWAQTRRLAITSLCAASAEAVFSGLQTPGRHVFIALLAFPFVATSANRICKQVLDTAGLWKMPVVIIDDDLTSGGMAPDLARTLECQIVETITPNSVLAAPGVNRLGLILKRCHASYVLVALGGDRQRQIVDCILRECVPFAVVTTRGFPSDPTVTLSRDIMLLLCRDTRSQPIARAIKVMFDVLVAGLLVVWVSPLLLILTILCRRDGGRAFFGHRRVGMGGRPFRCLKFRTMVPNAEKVLEDALARDSALAAEWAATRKLVNDPRVTRMGRFLRETSLDELPQLFNVLRLEMSLVGPRPIVRGEIPLYGENIVQYHAVRPGITGLWQVNGRNKVSYARRVELDSWYVNNWSLRTDVGVLLKTVPAVFCREGAC